MYFIFFFFFLFLYLSCRLNQLIGQHYRSSRALVGTSVTKETITLYIMHIQAVTFFVVALILVNLASGSFGWQTTDDENYEVKMGGYPNQLYPSVLDVPITSEEAVELDDRIPLQRLALRLLEANREGAAFRRDTREQHYYPRKPTCRGNTCNQRGWKRSLATTVGDAEDFRRDTRHYSPQKPTCHGDTCNQRGWKRSWASR